MRVITLDRRGAGFDLEVRSGGQLVLERSGGRVEIAKAIGDLAVDETQDLLVTGIVAGVGLDDFAAVLGVPRKRA